MAVIHKLPCAASGPLREFAKQPERVAFELAIENIYAKAHRVPPVQHVALFDAVVAEHAVATEIDGADALLLVVMHKYKAIRRQPVVTVADGSPAFRIPGRGRQFFLSGPPAGEPGKFAMGFDGFGHFHIDLWSRDFWLVQLRRLICRSDHLRHQKSGQRPADYLVDGIQHDKGKGKLIDRKSTRLNS